MPTKTCYETVLISDHALQITEADICERQRLIMDFIVKSPTISPHITVVFTIRQVIGNSYTTYMLSQAYKSNTDEKKPT